MSRVRAGWAGRLATVVALSGLVAGMAPTAPAAPHVPVEACPGLEIMPTDDVRAGMTGTGLTVVQGRDPVAFDVEVLGVLRDALLPGRHLIVVEASGPDIDRVGGVWFGMSGSPVYVDDKLLGAVAWGFSFGPSPVVGLTSAEDMAEVLLLEGDGSSEKAPSRIHLPPRLRRVAARRGGLTPAQAEQGMVQMKVPFSISGVAGRGIRRIGEVVRDTGLPLIPYAGASAPAPAGPLAAEPLEPGDSLAGVLSFGDVTSGAIGTATFVCPEFAVGFGHPFFWQGSLPFAATHAETLTIWPDPVFGPFKLATVEEVLGVIDQDRFAGIRAALGREPTLIPITSSTAALNTGRSRDGRTDVVDSEFVPFLAFSHLFSNIDSAFDQISGGSSSVGWTITGTRESGEPWALARRNVYVSRFDISFGSGFELLGQLISLLENPFEEIEFSSVHVTPTVQEPQRRYRMTGVEVSVNGGPFIERRRVRVRKGDVVVARLLLHDAQEEDPALADTVAEFTTVVPRLRGAGFLEMRAGTRGAPPLECLFFPEECVADTGVGSFDELLTFLEGQPTNDEIRATLLTDRGARDRGTVTLDRFVRGLKRIRLVPKTRR